MGRVNALAPECRCGSYFGKLSVFQQNRHYTRFGRCFGDYDSHPWSRSESEPLDSGFRFQHDGNPIANGIHTLALVALEAIFTAHYQWLSAYRTGEDFQQFGADHGSDFSLSANSILILKTARARLAL